MVALPPPGVFERLDRLRTELADYAFILDRRGRPDAADVALLTSARLGEICAELGGADRSATDRADERGEPPSRGALP